MPLEPHDARRLEAAQGFVALRMYLDANAELESITTEMRAAPEVLAVRLDIYCALEKWELMQAVASALARGFPDDPFWIGPLAHATRKAQSLEVAKAVLLAAVERHPTSAKLSYRLACYECQLGELEVAKARLRHAFKLDPHLRMMALDDEDLRPLWDSL